jgi:hypothetical protein
LRQTPHILQKSSRALIIANAAARASVVPQAAGQALFKALCVAVVRSRGGTWRRGGASAAVAMEAG